MKRRDAKLEKSEKTTLLPSTPPKSSSSLPSESCLSIGSSSKTNGGVKTDTFEARRSTRVSTKKYAHDGDSWQETLAVCEIPKSKDSTDVSMVVRSYYVNQRTSERVWDEPPSGATRILPATEEMRKMAELQLNEMQITFGALDEKQKPTKKKGGFFRRSSKETAEETTVTRRKIQYKPGSFLSGIKKGAPPPRSKADELLDPDVQKAIALSVAGQSDHDGQAGDTENDSSSKQVQYRDDDDMLAMVMAISASEVECHPKYHVSEEEMFQRALEESQRKTAGVASLPVGAELLVALSSSSSDEKYPAKAAAATTDDASDQKMPAKPSESNAKKSSNEEAREQKESTIKSSSVRSLRRSSSRKKAGKQKAVEGRKAVEDTARERSDQASRQDRGDRRALKKKSSRTMAATS